jgi:hypothetical protein
MSDRPFCRSSNEERQFNIKALSKMKKVIFFCGASLLVFLLVGCDGGGSTVTKESQAAKPGMSAAARKDKRGD